MSFLALFIISNIINVTLSTIKSIVTVKGGKVSAALINAITYGFYTVIIFMTADADGGLTILEKAIIIGTCNLVCVFAIKLVEEKKRKSQLWKVEMSVNVENEEGVKNLLNDSQIPYNYIEGVGKYVIFNVFCATEKQSIAVKEIVKTYNVKYFVSESKNL